MDGESGIEDTERQLGMELSSQRLYYPSQKLEQLFLEKKRIQEVNLDQTEHKSFFKSNTQLPVLDLTQATQLQEKVANKETRNQIDERNLKQAFTDLTKKYDDFQSEYNECKHRLEARIIEVKNLEENQVILKQKLVKYARTNRLLTAALSKYEKNWIKLNHEYEFYRNFYGLFLGFLNDQYESHFKVVNLSSLNQHVRQFREMYRTERNFDPDSLTVKNIYEPLNLN